MAGPQKGSREKAFAKRLSDAMDNHPRCPSGHGRNTWLQRELTHKNVKVSLETLRKWLAAETMPRRARMAALAKVLHVDETWLAMGAQPSLSSGPAMRIKELEKALERIAKLDDIAAIHTICASALGKAD